MASKQTAPIKVQHVELDDSWSADMHLKVFCPDCGGLMIADNREGSQDSWNESLDLCVMTVACITCCGTGSIHLNVLQS